MTTTPPAAPNVFTAFLMGDQKYKYTLVPQLDAPVSPHFPVSIAELYARCFRSILLMPMLTAG
jgi:hypothetical protein